MKQTYSHLRYKDENGKSILYREQMCDLEVLCKSCHEIEHGIPQPEIKERIVVYREELVLLLNRKDNQFYWDNHSLIGITDCLSLIKSLADQIDFIKEEGIE